MIFKTKKQFEEEVFKRMNEIDFHTKTDERIYRLENTVQELRYRLESLEQSVRQPTPTNMPQTQCDTPIRDFMVNPTYEPAPYWMNPNFKMPEVTCENPYQTTCTTANDVKAE